MAVSSCFFSFSFFFISLLLLLPIVQGKFFIQPCSSSEGCRALLGYRVAADTKVSSVAAMFGVDSVQLLGANNYGLELADPEDAIVEAGELLRIPINCACSPNSGIRKASSVFYTTRGHRQQDEAAAPAAEEGEEGGDEEEDSLLSIANQVFSGLVTPQQIAEANAIDASSAGNFSIALHGGRRLIIPFPCACSSSSAATIVASYQVQAGDSEQRIAQLFQSRPESIASFNAGPLAVGDTVGVPILACSSSSLFDPGTQDADLLVASGTYTITADHCVQCSCGYKFPSLDCTRAPPTIGSSCPSTSCSNGAYDLELGDEMSTPQASSNTGSNQLCLVTSCEYAGFNESGILHRLRSSSKPTCPGPRPPPSYRQYMPALSPDASPVIEPQNMTSSSNEVVPVPDPAVSSSSISFRLSIIVFCCTTLMSSVTILLA